MPDDIQLTDEQDEALERAWEKVSQKQQNAAKPQAKSGEPKKPALPSDEEFFGAN